MGICFVGKRKSFPEFLTKYIEPKNGKIVLLSNGKIIGSHSGVFNFTLGKRISVPTQNFQSHDGLFVSKIDPINQILYVCEGSQNPSLFAQSFKISSPFWILNSPTKEKLEFALQRNQPLLECNYSVNNNLVIPKRPVRAAALGQMCVFYDKEICLGGGQIDKIIKTLDS
uniref:Uncharacterized protein n=1 Tax=Panagrolaimus sp. PS1159 TaxID=55785 RepID=A0AC35GU96_9BILA